MKRAKEMWGQSVLMPSTVFPTAWSCPIGDLGRRCSHLKLWGICYSGNSCRIWKGRYMWMEPSWIKCEAYETLTVSETDTLLPLFSMKCILLLTPSLGWPCFLLFLPILGDVFGSGDHCIVFNWMILLSPRGWEEGEGHRKNGNGAGGTSVQVVGLQTCLLLIAQNYWILSYVPRHWAKH